MKEEIKRIIIEELDNAIRELEAVKNQTNENTIVETIRSAQDDCEIIIETMLRKEYSVPRDEAEDIAANVCRKLLPYFRDSNNVNVQ